MIVTKKKLILYYLLASYCVIAVLVLTTNFFSESPFQQSHRAMWSIVIIPALSILILHKNYLRNRGRQRT